MSTTRRMFIKQVCIIGGEGSLNYGFITVLNAMTVFIRDVSKRLGFISISLKALDVLKWEIPSL